MIFSLVNILKFNYLSLKLISQKKIIYVTTKKLLLLIPRRIFPSGYEHFTIKAYNRIDIDLPNADFM